MGTTEEAFNFYKSIFEGEFTKIIRFKEIASAEMRIEKNDEEKIMHIELHFGKNILMANDVPEKMGRVNENENRSKIFIRTESREEANNLFNGLSSEGNVEVSYEDSQSGRYFGMFRDKFGIEWMIDFDPQAQ